MIQDIWILRFGTGLSVDEVMKQWVKTRPKNDKTNLDLAFF